MRAYQKPNLPAISLSERALAILDLLSDPVAGSKNTSPLELEIGCGVGLHPILWGKANPDRQLIAVEHTAEKFQKFEGRLARHPTLTQVVAVHANAMTLIDQRIPPQTIDRIWLLYPNPYPKKQDQARRWHAMPFASQLVAILKPGGQLVSATNLEWYALEARQFWTTHWGLREREFQAIEPGSEFVPRTHFEKKYLARGERCWSMIFEKPYD